MKNRISLFILTLFMSINILAQQNKTACNSCTAESSGIYAYKYIADRQVNYKVTDCVPFSDVELYSVPSGGAVVAYATADEKGEANFILPANTPVAFALNHNRVNSNGIAGKGQIFNFSEPVLDIESPALSASENGEITINWRAGTTNKDWAFNVQKSPDGQNFITIATIAAKATQNYSAKNQIDNPKIKSVFYRIEAQNKSTGAIVQSAATNIVINKSYSLFTAIVLNNQIQVKFTKDINFPASFMITDMSGIKVASGILRSKNQLIDFNVYQNKNYVLSIITDGGVLGSQIIFKN